MYIRAKKNTTGQIIQLVEAYRNAQGVPRQRIVTSLGDAAIPEKDWREIASAVEKRLYGHEELFQWKYDKKKQAWIDHIVRQVDLQGRWHPLINTASDPADQESDSTIIPDVVAEGVTHENACALGPVLVGWHAWKELKIDGVLQNLGFNKPQRQAAAVNVINRLVDPVSENALRDWVSGTSLPELLGDESLGHHRDRYYRVTDQLWKNRKAIEAHLQEAQRRDFGLKRQLYLYDLTNTYFEGSAQKNPQARRGNSKHKRSDCPQIVLGMVYDEYGFEVAHEVFEGNRHDSTTLLEILEKLEEVVKEDGDMFTCKPVVILDGGIATKDNLKILREKNYAYLVNQSRPGRKKYMDEFQVEDFSEIEQAPAKSLVEVKTVDCDETPEDRLVLCRSRGRLKKETAIFSNAEERFRADAEKLTTRLAKGLLKQRDKVDQAIGRLSRSHPRVARFYDVSCKQSGKDLSLVWERKDQEVAEHESLFGCYVLQTNLPEIDGPELWQIYMTLTRAEDGFRSLKSDLGLRPIRHQVERRVNAHVFITILAYHLLRRILFKLEQAGDFRRWETIKRLLCTHAYTTIILPTKSGQIWRLRRASQPDECQKAIYRHLELDWKNLPLTREQIG